MVQVTQQEYPVRPDCAIISHTDHQGTIVYVNDDFVEYAGYTRAELIGQPHNMIRHPDMPKEAFRDMWATLKAGRAWQGMVKNRRKNGDHYWVKATATPRTGGGYMSVRLQPTREEVQAAEQLYKEMRAGSRVRLSGGYILPHWRARFYDAYVNLSLTTTALLPMFFMLVCLVSIGAWQYFSVEDEAFRSVLANFMVSLLGISIIGLSWLYWVLRSNAVRLERLKKIAIKIGTGNLITPIPIGKRDEIGSVFNAVMVMRNRLFEIAFQMTQSAKCLTQATAEMHEASDATAQGALEQSQASAGMAAALEELSASVDQIGDNAAEVHSTSLQAGETRSSWCRDSVYQQSGYSPCGQGSERVSPTLTRVRGAISKNWSDCFDHS